MTPQPRPDRDRAGRETRHVGILGTPADVRRARAAARREDTTTAQAQPRWENRASLPEPAPPPASGRPGADALRCWLPLRLPAHRASSATLAGAYPFLAGPRVPTDGVYVGQDAFSGGPFCFDPWTWYAAGRADQPQRGPRRGHRRKASPRSRSPWRCGHCRWGAASTSPATPRGSGRRSPAGSVAP